jgi:hypothetical protein
VEYVATMESFHDAVAYPYDVHASRTTADTPIEYDKLRHFFGWIPTATIKRTFDCTTCWARYSGHYPLCKHFKSRFPSLNVHQRQRRSQLIPFSPTLLPLIMVPPAHKSSLAWIPSSQMPTALNLTANLSQRWRTIFANGEQ